jgi:two-component system, NtrC family, response regulator AtoC
MKILIVDDDEAICRSLQISLEDRGHQTHVALTGGEALALLESDPPDLALLDLNLPDLSGIEVLRRIRERGSSALAIMITGQQDAKATIDAMRLGAFDYIRKPLDLDHLFRVLDKVRHHLREEAPEAAVVATATDAKAEIVGAHPKIIDVLKQIAVFSESRIPMLILGESGTGKELVARAIHEVAAPEQPFVAVNCSAVVSTLLESELFGHEKGAFTGADTTKVGKLEFAGEGSVFLDEIGDMSFDLQAKLLRALQEKEFERVGGTRPIRFRARVIAATHRDLQRLVREGRFRDDLYYRLAVSTIGVPALRDRREDILLIVKHLIARNARELHRDVRGIQREALQRLQLYDWPGNVRELANVVIRAMLLTRGETITEEAIVKSMGETVSVATDPESIVPLWRVERDYIEKALLVTGWNITRTAEKLDISRVTLRKKIQDYGLSAPGD